MKLSGRFIEFNTTKLLACGMICYIHLSSVYKLSLTNEFLEQMFHSISNIIHSPNINDRI